MTNPVTVGLKEAAASIGLSHWTLRKYIREGKLPSVRVGRRVLLEVAEIARLIQSGRQQN